MALLRVFVSQLFHLVLLDSADAGMSTPNVLPHRYLRAAAANAGAVRLATREGPLSMKANDMWALHDLLLIGYHGIFLQPNSAAKREVQEAATRLAKMLPRVHPHKACRTVLAQVVGKSATPDISVVAEAAWACLPQNFSSADFDTAFLKESDGAAAKMPRPKEHVELGACQGSGWPRTCSYWVSLHLMAFRADVFRLGTEFVHAVIPLLAGGAVLCNGCTHHLMALHKPVLSESMLRDRHDTI